MQDGALLFSCKCTQRQSFSYVFSAKRVQGAGKYMMEKNAALGRIKNFGDRVPEGQLVALLDAVATEYEVLELRITFLYIQTLWVGTILGSS